MYFYDISKLDDTLCIHHGLVLFYEQSLSSTPTERSRDVLDAPPS